jgi:predicted DNA-binding transcriptional regulator AlpA
MPNKQNALLDRLLTTQETASVFGVAPNTLEKWRVSGRGPKFVHVGRRVRYRPADVAAYIADQTRASTSAA